MEIGMSTASLFNRFALEETPALLQEYGVSLCEIFLNSFSEYRPAFVELLAARVQKAGLRVHSVHPMGAQFEAQLFSPHPRQRADAWLIFEDVLCAGKRLGARYYTMHGPGSLGGAVKNMELARIGPIVRDLCELAATYDMCVAWENVSWGLYSEPFFGPALLESAGTDLLCFTLDTKQAARSGRSPLEYLAVMGERLVNVHICDYVTTPARVMPALPGRGECDFPAFFQALRAAGYAGSVLFEVYSDLYMDEREMLESYRYIKTCLEAQNE